MNSNEKSNSPSIGKNQGQAPGTSQKGNKNSQNLGQSLPRQDQPQQEQQGHDRPQNKSSSSGRPIENSAQQQTGFGSGAQGGSIKPSERSPKQENL